MHPILIDLGFYQIRTYGACVALGFYLGMELCKRLVQKRMPGKLAAFTDLSFWGLIVGFVGARLLYVLTALPYFSEDITRVVKIWEGGLVFFGGPLAVIPYTIWYVRKHKLRLWDILDVMTPGLVLAHAIGRIGCFFAGCCYGCPTNVSWAVKFEASDIIESSLRHVAVHPVQLYESFLLFMLCGFFVWLFKRGKSGQVTVAYLLIYPCMRTALEMLRGDVIRGFVGPLSTSQWISGFLFVVGIACLFRHRLVRK